MRGERRVVRRVEAHDLPADGADAGSLPAGVPAPRDPGGEGGARQVERRVEQHDRPHAFGAAAGEGERDQAPQGFTEDGEGAGGGVVDQRRVLGGEGRERDLGRHAGRAMVRQFADDQVREIHEDGGARGGKQQAGLKARQEQRDGHAGPRRGRDAAQADRHVAAGEQHPTAGQVGSQGSHRLLRQGVKRRDGGIARAGREQGVDPPHLRFQCGHRGFQRSPGRGGVRRWGGGLHGRGSAPASRRTSRRAVNPW